MSYNLESMGYLSDKLESLLVFEGDRYRFDKASDGPCLCAAPTRVIESEGCGPTIVHRKRKCQKCGKVWITREVPFNQGVDIIKKQKKIIDALERGDSFGEISFETGMAESSIRAIKCGKRVAGMECYKPHVAKINISNNIPRDIFDSVLKSAISGLSNFENAEKHQISISSVKRIKKKAREKLGK